MLKVSWGGVVKIKKLISYFFFLFGVVMFVWLLLAGIHELGHYLNAKSLNATIDEVCLIGWDGSHPAWIVYSVDEENFEKAKKFDKWWDCLWSFGSDESFCK